MLITQQFWVVSNEPLLEIGDKKWVLAKVHIAFDQEIVLALHSERVIRLNPS